MKRESGTEVYCLGKLTGLESVDPDSQTRPQSDESDCKEHGYGTRVRAGEENGFSVYTRSKRLRTGRGGGLECFDTLFPDVVDSNGIGTVEGTKLEVKEESGAVVMKSYGGRRFTISVLKLKEEASEMENGSVGGLQNGVAHEVDGVVCEEMVTLDSPAKKMEMKMSKKIIIKGRRATVRGLFDTGLLEGYPVFCNGGKRGFPLRGTIKDGGIICSCSLCKGVRVVQPCQF